MKGYRKKISTRVNIQPRKKRTLKIHRNKSKKIRRGGTMVPTNASHKIGKSIMLTIHPSKLDNSKFISNVSVSGYDNNIDETLSSMVKSLNPTHQLERPIYSKKISIDLMKKKWLSGSNREKSNESNTYKKDNYSILSNVFSKRKTPSTTLTNQSERPIYSSQKEKLDESNIQKKDNSLMLLSSAFSKKKTPSIVKRFTHTNQLETSIHSRKKEKLDESNINKKDNSFMSLSSAFSKQKAPSIVKQFNHTNQLERPIYLRKKELLPQSNEAKLNPSNEELLPQSNKAKLNQSNEELLPQSNKAKLSQSNKKKLDITNIYNVNGKSYESISSNVFEDEFKVSRAIGDGNCLFYSLVHELQKKNVKTNQFDIRKNIATIYKNIKALHQQSGAESNLDAELINPVTNNKLDNIDVLRLRILLNLEEVDKDDGNLHSNVVGKNNVYGNIMEILTSSILYDTNILVYEKNKLGDVYDIMSFAKEGATENEPLRLLYNGNHYDALDVKMI